MSETIPLFPLGSVLFPGIRLPLHIFEERYRALVSDLATRAEGPARRFGVVAIREGWEVGADSARQLYEVGCAVRLLDIEQHDDGRYDILTVGVERFRVRSVDAERHPYLVGEVEWLEPTEPEPGPTERMLAASVAALFGDYVAAVAEAQGTSVNHNLTGEHPVRLSYLVGSAALLTLADRQRVLEMPDTAARLRLEIDLLKRETTMVRALRAVPAPLRELHVARSMN